MNAAGHNVSVQSRDFLELPRSRREDLAESCEAIHATEVRR
jgi:hypothetical protein